MITKQDAICINVTEAEIKSVIAKAREYFAIAQRNNLRNRHINIQFDCIVRGYIGEYAMARWLDENEIFVSNQNFKADGDSIDIDFVYKGKNLELKTSLIPDADKTIENVIARRDIKLIKRKNNIEELEGDIHLQIIFNQLRKAKDQWLQMQKVNIGLDSINELYNKLGAWRYKNDIFFVGWIDKNTLIKKTKSMPMQLQTWSFKNALRNFWNCKIAESNKPIDLPAYLKTKY